MTWYFHFQEKMQAHCKMKKLEEFTKFPRKGRFDKMKWGNLSR